MRRMAIVGGMVFGLIGASTVVAAPVVPNARIDAVQGPVWVERQGQRLPLAVGSLLKNRDRIVTGDEGRVVVDLADGSAVKLGAQGSVTFNAMQQQSRNGRGHFSAAVDVAKGAFRLTTDIFKKYRSERTINVRAGTVTAGIRGTDIWGRSSEARDFVCLLEGQIVATHPQGAPVELTQPLSFYGADRDQAPGPVAQADPAEVATWAKETELQPGRGVQQRAGRWQLLYGPFAENEALAHYDNLRAAGLAVRLVPQLAATGYRYSLRLSNLQAETDAQALAGWLAGQLELPAAQISRR